MGHNSGRECTSYGGHKKCIQKFAGETSWKSTTSKTVQEMCYEDERAEMNWLCFLYSVTPWYGSVET
jgi:hypothetical protein